MATTVGQLSQATRQPVAKTNWFRAFFQSYLVQKLLKTLLTIFVVTTLIFFMIRLLPGDPVDQFVNQLVVQYGTPVHEARDQAASLFAIDLNKPLHLQYLDYMGNLLRGNLGTSILSPGTPVTAIIQRFLPWTIFSVGTGLLLSFTLGVTLGLLMAYRRNSWFDHLATVLASLFSSVPNYLTAILLVVWLGVQWKIVPIAQMRGSLSPGMQPHLSWAFIQDVFFHAALPITTYVLTSIGGWMISMKSSSVAVLGEDYVTVAKARGLKEWRITTAYVGRNAALPLFTQLAIVIGFAMGGSFLIEQIFKYQGIGYILGDSISRRDYTVMQGVFLVITLSVVFANFFADLLYSWLDPRIKIGHQE
jgi:peptide/nickel transport system permease protein